MNRMVGAVPPHICEWGRQHHNRLDDALEANEAAKYVQYNHPLGEAETADTNSTKTTQQLISATLGNSASTRINCEYIYIYPTDTHPSFKCTHTY